MILGFIAFRVEQASGLALAVGAAEKMSFIYIMIKILSDKSILRCHVID